jgi:aryl-alcohol dehydrogenase-like predicted oxidoreductase
MAEGLADYRTLGRTGVKVSPFALGAMTFGWGADQGTARRIFDRYREAGGNFVDTADSYAKGVSEEWLGSFVKETASRDTLVIATKFGFNAQPGNPHAGGNGRKNILRAVEGSLRRLQTDYIDLYILHVYDLVTPAEEVMTTLDGLVRAGKIRHVGMSDAPAWYVARAQTIAELRGLERIATLQLEYSLVSRGLEREHLPLARELSISLTPWSPLASGFLTGKFRRENGRIVGQGRVIEVKDSGNPVLEKFAKREQNWVALEALLGVARRLERPPAEVALAWVAQRPQVASVLIGATSLAQLDANLLALSLRLPAEAVVELDAASAPEPNELDHFFGPTLQHMVTGGTRVERGTP